MTRENINDESAKSENQIIKEEVNLQFHWYLLAFFAIFTLSFLIPGIIFTLYLNFFFTPYFLETSRFSDLFLNLNSILALILMPLVVIICYLIHLFFVGLITRIFWSYTERKSPTKDGVIPRNIPSKTLDYYNIRSFMIKYPKNALVKGPFPWLLNWFYNYVGANKIGKNTTIEEQFGADRYIDIGDNCYVGVNCGFSSHSVEGVLGNIAYFEIKLGDNVTTAGLNCLAPGVEIKDNAYLLPLAGAVKHSTIKGKDNFYFGAPLRKIFTKKIMNYLKISEQDIQKNAEMMERNKQLKKSKNESMDNKNDN